MWLLDKMLRKMITIGELVVINHDGTAYRFGSPAPDVKPVTVRLTDRRAAMHIARDPRVGAGEVYMDGRLVVEQGDIRDLTLLIQKNAPFERPDGLKPHGLLRRAAEFTAARLDQINWRTRSRRNAEHTYNLTRRLYELFWTRIANIPALTIATRATASNKLSSTRKRTLQPSSI
jgi:cyclopropane-fatty-acyl-phospholipid synthase